MKLTIFAEHTDGVREFYEQIKTNGFGGSIKAVRLDEFSTKSGPGYAVRLKGSCKDCCVMLRVCWEGFPTYIVIGWPKMK